MSYVRSIPVEDANGGHLIAYEFEDWHFFFWKSRRFELDTGEILKPIDDKIFEVAATGERLTRLA